MNSGSYAFNDVNKFGQQGSSGNMDGEQTNPSENSSEWNSGSNDPADSYITGDPSPISYYSAIVNSVEEYSVSAVFTSVDEYGSWAVNELPDVTLFAPLVIEDTQGLYYKKFCELVGEYSTSVLSNRELEFPTLINSDNLRSFEYLGMVYYFDPANPRNQFDFEEIKRYLAQGKVWSINVCSRGVFLYDPIQVSILTRMFKTFNPRTEESDGENVRVIIGEVN